MAGARDQKKVAKELKEKVSANLAATKNEKFASLPIEFDYAKGKLDASALSLTKTEQKTLARAAKKGLPGGKLDIHWKKKSKAKPKPSSDKTASTKAGDAKAGDAKSSDTKAGDGTVIVDGGSSEPAKDGDGALGLLAGNPDPGIVKKAGSAPIEIGDKDGDNAEATGDNAEGTGDNAEATGDKDGEGHDGAGEKGSADDKEAAAGADDIEGAGDKDGEGTDPKTAEVAGIADIPDGVKPGSEPKDADPKDAPDTKPEDGKTEPNEPKTAGTDDPEAKAPASDPEAKAVDAEAAAMQEKEDAEKSAVALKALKAAIASGSITFAPNQFKLTDDHTADLKKLAGLVNDYGKPLTLDVKGFAQDDCDTCYANELSHRRAGAVIAGLIKAGVPSSSLKLEAAIAPVVETANDAKSEQRRVELNLVP